MKIIQNSPVKGAESGVENASVVPGESEDAAEKATTRNEEANAPEDFGRSEAHVAEKGRVHGEERNLQERGAAAGGPEPGTEGEGSAGAEADVVGEANGGIVGEAEIVPEEPGVGAPAEEILTAAERLIAEDFAELIDLIAEERGRRKGVVAGMDADLDALGAEFSDEAREARIAEIVAGVEGAGLAGLPIDGGIDVMLGGETEEPAELAEVGGLDVEQGRGDVAESTEGTAIAESEAGGGTERKGKADFVHVVTELDAEAAFDRLPAGEKLDEALFEGVAPFVHDGTFEKATARGDAGRSGKAAMKVTRAGERFLKTTESEERGERKIHGTFDGAGILEAEKRAERIGGRGREGDVEVGDESGDAFGARHPGGTSDPEVAGGNAVPGFRLAAGEANAFEGAGLEIDADVAGFGPIHAPLTEIGGASAGAEEKLLDAAEHGGARGPAGFASGSEGCASGGHRERQWRAGAEAWVIAERMTMSKRGALCGEKGR